MSFEGKAKEFSNEVQCGAQSLSGGELSRRGDKTLLVSGSSAGAVAGQEEVENKGAS